MSAIPKRIRTLIFISAGIAALGCILYVLAKLGIPVPCVFYQVTGLRCPGCGNTRAVLALLRLQFSEAIGYNLLFPAEILYILWVYFAAARRYWKEGKFSYRPPLPALDIIFLIVLLIWWIVRNILHI